jgi:1-phosphatidylinositol phosphodiesterase
MKAQLPMKSEACLADGQVASKCTSDRAFTLSYSSASAFPLALPPVMAKGFGYPSWGLGVEGINSRILGWLLGFIADGRIIKGGVVMDYYRQVGAGPGAGGEDQGVRELLVLMNTMSGGN